MSARRPPLDRQEDLLLAARAIVSGRTWAGLRRLVDLLEGRPGIDPAELAELRERTRPPPPVVPSPARRQPPSGSAA